MQFSVGIRVVGFISFALSIILLSVCGWTYYKFSTGQIGNNSTLNVVEHQSEPQKGAVRQEISTIVSTYSLLQKEWKDFKPFLMGSGGVALACGVLQMVAALGILCTGPQGARDRTGCFKMTHFVVAIGLIVALIVPAVFDVSHDSWSQKLRVLFQDVKEEFHNFMMVEGFNPDVVTAYYAVIAIDVSGIMLIILSTCCLMRNAEYDYREYP